MQPIYHLTLGKAIFFLADAGNTAVLKKKNEDNKDVDNTA